MTAPSNPYPALASTIDPTILRSIRQASQATSTDFGLLMAQAAQESSFRADAKSTTSSASGLFQFVDSTWLSMVQRFGAKYGLGQLAQQIGQDGSGKPAVSDPSVRREILDLRRNPAVSAALAGEYDKLNETQVESALGHPVNRADLYLAHFLGAGGATSFLKALESKGNTDAAGLLPEAAAANPSIFYDAATGKSRTIADIYHALATKIDAEATALDASAPAAPPWAANAVEEGAGPSSSGFSVSSMGHTIDWSGVKLSAPVLAMLDVVAEAALKMTDDAAPNSLPPLSPDPRERHSI